MTTEHQQHLKDVKERATTSLALAAFKADIIDAESLGFIVKNPDRAGEVEEFVAWMNH